MTESSSHIRQVYYSNWSDKLAVGHENYWFDISKIAELIGSSLDVTQVRLTNQGISFVPLNSITVLQYKEKFGGVRVYCHLCSHEKVQILYEKHIEEVNFQNARYEQYKLIKDESEETKRAHGFFGFTHYVYNEDNYPKAIMPFEDFKKKRLIEDAKWYRGAYLDMVRLFPHYKDAICGSADFREYLFSTQEELNSYVETRKAQISEIRDQVLRDNQSSYLEDSIPHIIEVCGFNKIT